MYIQCSTVKRKGKTSRNRKLVESYRDPKTKQPRVRTVQKIEPLPIAERAKLIYEFGGKKYLTTQEWDVLNELGLLARQQVAYEVGDVYRGAGTAVTFWHMKASGMFKVLDKHMSRRGFDVIKELVIHQLLYPRSKLKFTRLRKSGLLYLLGGKRNYKEDTVYLALDELATNMEGIKKDLVEQLDEENRSLLLYDLSNSYFTGTKAELGGRGESKEKRHDRYIVSYGLVMNQHNMPLDIRIWKGGTADAKTVLGTFAQWKTSYKASRAIWIGDRSMSGEINLDEIKRLDLNYITGLPGNTQQAVLLLKQEQQPELFDQSEITSFVHEGKRYVLCRHQSKGYRRERQGAQHRRKVYEELKKIQQSPQNKDDKKLYHRAMRALEKYEQTTFWDIEVEPLAGQEKQKRYVLNFRLNRTAVIAQDRIGHYYLLQTDLDAEQITDNQVAESYKSLMMVEKSFRDIKSQIEVRPIRHWKNRRIKAHIYLCYLSLWLSKYIENKWKEKNITTEVGPTLEEWDQKLLMSEKIDPHGNMVEVCWNKGKNATEALKQIQSYEEVNAINAHV
jgi:transposase